MDIQTFFNKPARPIDIQLIIKDMIKAKKVLVLASAWLTHREIANTFISSDATHKYAILNGVDISRNGGSKAVMDLYDYFGTQLERDNTDFAILGNKSFEEGVMHHKFIICDDIVWVGSLNFTYQALKNYENIIRIHDRKIAKEYFTEAIDLLTEVNLWDRSGQFDYSYSAFRCCSCEKITPNNELGLDCGSTKYCKKCIG